MGIMNLLIGSILTGIEHTRRGYHDYKMYTEKYD